MLEMTGVLRQGNDGYIVRAPETPIILLDRNHGPTQQYLKAFGRKLIDQKVPLLIVDQLERYWRAQIAPDELKAKGFGRVQGR